MKKNITHSTVEIRPLKVKALLERISVLDLIRRLGAAAIERLKKIGSMGIFLGKALFYTFTTPLKFSHLLKQIQFIGFQSISLIVLTGGFTGMVLSYQGFNTLTRFGSEAFLGPMVALSLIKEMGPVISALMVTGRAGSSITAEIGIMRISEQIDALELMGLNPFRYLIIPNLLAGIIALPLLTAIFNVVGIFGGYLVGVKLLGVGSGTYFGEMITRVEMMDIWESVYKSLNFGAIITWVCCFKGYNAGFRAESVSKSTTQAVVLSSVLILIWDYFMTSTLF